MLLYLSILACLFLVPCVVLVGTWLKHLPSATEICERVGKLGKGRFRAFFAERSRRFSILRVHHGLTGSP
jgi:hypothetical protein